MRNEFAALQIGVLDVVLGSIAVGIVGCKIRLSFGSPHRLMLFRIESSVLVGIEDWKRSFDVRWQASLSSICGGVAGARNGACRGERREAKGSEEPKRTPPK